MKSKILSLTNFFILLAILGAWWITAKRIEPFLHFHFQQIGFLTTLDFFKSYTTYPGGIADYVAEFVSQFFSFNLFGSLLIVAIASFQGFIVLDTVARLTGKSRLGFSVFAIVLLFGVIVLCDYRYPYYASIRLLFAFIFTWGFFFINHKNPGKSIYIWPFIALLLFYIASGPALFVFTLSTAIILIHTEKSKIWMKVIPVFLLFAGILPFIGYKFIFQESLQNLYKIVVMRHPELLTYTTLYQLYIYYSLLPGILFIFLFAGKIPENQHGTNLKKGEKSPKAIFFKKTPFILAIQIIGIALPGYFMFIKSHDPFKKKLLYIEYYAENGQWNKVLNVAEDIKTYDFRVNFQVNRAYAHFGQLPERLFNYPQLLGVYALFYDNSNINGSLIMPNSDLYFDLGLMSESQRWAFEAQTLMPYSPRILKRLIMINIINRKYKLAEEFLNVLDHNLLYNNWVARYRKYVSDTTLASKDKVIAEKRRFNPWKEHVHLEPLGDLELLLETNKGNRLAYDYLLTYCVLTSDFPDFLKYLPWYTSYNMKSLPRSWEETLAVHILRTKAFPDFITPETISKGCLQQFVKFNNTLRQFNNDIRAAQGALQKDFEDTYWYYILYLDPKVTNVLNNKTLIR